MSAAIQLGVLEPQRGGCTKAQGMGRRLYYCSFAIRVPSLSTGVSQWNWTLQAGGRHRNCRWRQPPVWMFNEPTKPRRGRHSCPPVSPPPGLAISLPLFPVADATGRGCVGLRPKTTAIAWAHAHGYIMPPLRGSGPCRSERHRSSTEASLIKSTSLDITQATPAPSSHYSFSPATQRLAKQ
ncbi:hypothetical protein CA85_25930 [Allorhodopirellula solitaria]|uniref:Uncharacterized protein n=1 Tax=Allorhodopirellula solitaria TaxID=2527987 RepID=A0A5C5XUU5_9BACT|nr:hypothetical protein CA85_25930 [Allorhodopirellula solitaria]